MDGSPFFRSTLEKAVFRLLTILDTGIALQTIFETRQLPIENRIPEVDSLYQMTDEVLWD
jgi:hypothetical protein